MKWINPKEQLPEVGDQIFALATWREFLAIFPTMGWYEGISSDGKPRMRFNLGELSYVVIAWMPIPDNPDWLEEKSL